MFENPVNFIMFSFCTMFVAVLLLCLVIVIRQWRKDKHSPLIVTNASVLDKRIEEHYHKTRSSSGVGMTTHKYSLFYITFQLDGGDHIELRTNKNSYNKIKKGQNGKLTFKGSKYLGFETIR